MGDEDAPPATAGPSDKQKRPSYFNPKPPAIVPALIACHPHAPIVVVAIGAALRVLNYETGEALLLSDATIPRRHREAIRAIAFHPSGALFASGGDDKLVKVWDTATWTCRKTVSGPKKISSVVFSADARWLCFSDKYGIVHVTSTGGPGDAVDSAEAGIKQLLAHCSSIITSLAMSPDGRFIASADRDYKLRVSVFPATPLAGAPEIQSFCLGHTSYLTAALFLPGGLLVSAGGDGTLRLWQPQMGELLQTLRLAGEQEIAPVESVMSLDEGDSASESSGRAIVALALAPDGVSLAAALEGCSEVVFVHMVGEPPALVVAQRLSLGGRAPPTSLAFDAGGRVWRVAGAVQEIETGDAVVTEEALAAKEAAAAAAAASAAVQVELLQRRETGVSARERSAEPVGHGAGEEAASAAAVYEVGELPGGSAAQGVLEGSQADAQAAAEAAKAATEAMRNLLGKRMYTEAEKIDRKRNRNDQKPPRGKS
ncbi:WD repeat containing protein [Klebsormidium nitens]|uniref:tRNA (guanine-N(7)-)-methyltransferase non-catalytic subunit n=1 Tax=Klebsormidium nitens TaxID=105231 RepID=A0A1Y1I008_KLENI|nr:WD repeat containing protein [Klebsormidium nitens]|eukprot:GAQ84245.1 WD repeat containing protein [Klebsormidium nitens]